MTRTKTLIIRMTADERAALERRARAAGLSLSRALVEAALAPGAAHDPSARLRHDELIHNCHRIDRSLRALGRALGQLPPANPRGETDTQRLVRLLEYALALLRMEDS